MQVITNANPGNFRTDGVYIDQIAAPPPTPRGPDTALIGIVGTANYGPVDQAMGFVDAPSLALVFGNNSLLPNAIIPDSLLAMPECQDFLGVRVTDGTDTAATIPVKDTNGSPVVLFTLTNKYTGDLANAAYATLLLNPNSPSTAPTYNLSIFFPGYPTESFNNLVAYAAGVFSAPVLVASAIAAVNGLNPLIAGSVRWSATIGTASTHTPQTSNQVASGGTNGTTTITSSVLIGTAGNPGTGIYALSGQLSAGALIVAGLTDPTMAQALASFAATQNCVAGISFPSLTTTSTAQADIGTDNMVGDSLFLCMDFDSFYDPVAGIQRLIAPAGKIAGIFASLPAFQNPGNFPVGGAVGIIATDRAADPVVQAEAEQRQGSNLLYLSNNPNIFNRGTGYGLPFAKMSSGKLVSDIRMRNLLGAQLAAAYGPLVGSMQGPLPTSGQDTDPFRIALKDATDAVLQPYLQAKQIAAYSEVNNGTNNTNSTITQGFAFIAVAVTTLSAAEFIVVFLQVGNTVVIQQANVVGAAA